MQQSEFFSIQSPCKRICTVNKQGFCIGCLRTRPERFGWKDFSEQEKWEILQKCSRRLQRYKAVAVRKANEKYLAELQAARANEETEQEDLFTADGKPYRQFNQISLFHAGQLPPITPPQKTETKPQPLPKQRDFNF